MHHETGKTEELRVGNFINELTGQGILRDSQSLNMLFPELLSYLLSPKDQYYRQNWKTLINFLKQVKAEKLEQIKQGKVGIDLLSTLLNEGGDVYSMIEDKALADMTMLDDVSIIYLAAVNTTQISVNNLMKYMHMDEYRQSIREKLQAEVDSHLAFDVWDADGKMINEAQLRDACSYEKIQESFDFTMMCFRESLRIEPPIPFSSSHMFTRDVVLARGTPKELKVNAGQEVHIEMGLLHHNEKHWGPDHDKFIPERFDSASEHFKAPDGSARHPYAYAPFLGGHRICLGKTFAETVAKKLIAMVLKLYKLEHADPEMRHTTIKYDIYQLKPPTICYNFSKRTTQKNIE